MDLLEVGDGNQIPVSCRPCLRSSQLRLAEEFVCLIYVGYVAERTRAHADDGAFNRRSPRRVCIFACILSLRTETNDRDLRPYCLCWFLDLP